MNATEISALLAKAQLDDNRDISPEVIVRWTEILGPVTASFDDAVEALNMHRRESLTYLQPAHIIHNLRRIREERSAHYRPAADEDYRERRGFVPDPKPDNLEEMAAAWDDPVRFGIEVAKYRAQVHDHRQGHATRAVER